MSVDAVNSFFMLGGSFFMTLNILKLYKDKQVKGVFWATPLWSYTGQAWGVYFFYDLHQWHSFFSGVILVSLCFTWFFMMLYYNYWK